MRRLKLALALGVTGLAVFLFVMAFRATAAREQRSAGIQEASTKRDALAAEFRKIAGLAEATEARSADLTGKLAELKNQAEARASGFPRGPIHISSLAAFDPKFGEMVEKGMRARYETIWEPLYRSLNFSGKDRDDFWVLYKDFAERRGDVMQAAVKHQVGLEYPGVETLLQQEIAEMRKSMSARFGEAREKEFFEFLRQMESRSFADGLATRLAFTAPLSADQVNRVTQIVANATPRYAKGNFADNHNIDWAKVDEDVRGVLSAEQFEAWKRAGLGGPGGSRSREQTEMHAVYEQVLKAEKTGKASGAVAD